ncbi:MAG: carbohydrate-binding module family 20 domain-containing protein, partial [Pirellulaceae bacterium]
MKRFSEDFRTRLSVLATGVLGWLAVGLFQVAMTSPAAAVPSPGDDTVQVVFSVRLEKDFLARESSAPSLFLAGNLEQLGSWRPDGVRLDRQEDGEYRATVTLEVGKEVEFKVTAGSWGRVERDDQGRDIANR